MTTALNGDLGELNIRENIGFIKIQSILIELWRQLSSLDWVQLKDNFLCATEKDRLMLCKSLFASSIPWSEESVFKNMKMNWEKCNVWIMLTIYYQNIFSNIWLARKWQQNEKGQEKQNIKNNKKQRRALTRSESELSSETAHLSKSSWQTLPSEECTVADIFATFFYISTFSTLTP